MSYGPLFGRLKDDYKSERLGGYNPKTWDRTTHPVFYIVKDPRPLAALVKVDRHFQAQHQLPIEKLQATSTGMDW